MKKRLLNHLVVSEVGMGCMGLSHGYGEIPDEQSSIEAIRAAYEEGCTFFDTAEAYSPNLQGIGHNELIIGKAVKDFRQDIVLATKLHPVVKENQEKGTYQMLKDHLTASLERLQTGYVDLYYLHRVDRAIPVEDIAAGMGKLIQEGLIRGWGLSQVDVDTIAKAQEVTPLSAIQNIYSMVERTSEEEVIPYCISHNIGFVPFSPVASGLLSGKVTKETDFSHHDDVRKHVPQLSRENIDGNQPVLDLIAEFAEKKNATMAQISLAWMLYKYPNVVPIPGSKNKGRILENLHASDVVLSKEEFERLDSTLDSIPVKGLRGHVEFQGESMSSWGKK